MAAARQVPKNPSWVFDSPLLRRVLAEMNLAAVPVIVRAASGLSQRDFASVAGWSKDALGAYERGARSGVFDVRMLLPFADAIGMPREALLPLVLDDPEAGVADSDTGPGTMAEVGERRFGGLAAAVSLERRVAGRTASAALLRYWQAGTDILYAHSRAVGGSVLVRPALRHWQQVRCALTAGRTGKIWPNVLVTAGEAALCAESLALDAGTPQRARQLYALAEGLAREAEDAMLSAHVRTNLSMLEAEQARTGPIRGPARRALQHAYQAAEGARHLPQSRLHALIALRGASAASLLGDEIAFRAGITRARRELERGTEPDDSPEWLRFVTQGEIARAEAGGWLDLGFGGTGKGHPRPAAEAQARLTGVL